VASTFYPSWWFQKDEVLVARLRALGSVGADELTFSYRTNGETQVVAVSSDSIEDVASTLEGAGWIIEIRS
jgi:hypothetical protein